jgi:hypothetical protein
MTDAERRMVKELWRALFGRIHFGVPSDQRPDDYTLLHRLFWWPDRPITGYDRERLCQLAWEHRDKLPPDLVLIAALKGGVRI